MLNRSVRRLLPFLILLASLGLGFRAEAHLPKRSFTASNLIVRNGGTTNSQALEYDAENRLVRFSEVGRTAVEYGYSASGQRLWRRSYVTSTNSPKLQLWIGQHYEEKDGKELFHIFAGGQRVCTFERDSILNGGSGTSTNYVGYYYHQDHLGSSSVLSDYAGSLKELSVWYTFGRTQTNNPTAAFKVSHRFTGQIQDEETGLYYYNARYYDPELGRFIQADTIIPDLGNPQSFNRYAYVLNNPLRYVDQTGHAPQDYLGGWWASLSGTRRLDDWARSMPGHSFKSFADAEAYVRSQRDTMGINEDVAYSRAKGEGIAVAASSAGAMSSAYANSVSDVVGLGIKTAAVAGMKMGASRMGEAPGMFSEMQGKVAGWFGKKPGAELKGVKALELVPEQFRNSVARSFQGDPVARQLTEDLIVYGHWGGKAAESGSPWFTAAPYSKPGNARRYLALPEGNTAENVTAFRIPAGTSILEGKAASQAGQRGFGSGAVGGGAQIYLPDPSVAQPVK